LGHQFGETVYISEVNGVRKVKSNAQVTMKKLTPRAEIFSLGVDGQNSAPTQIFFKLLELSETSGARKLILRLQVDIGKADSRRYDVTR